MARPRGSSKKYPNPLAIEDQYGNISVSSAVFTDPSYEDIIVGAAYAHNSPEVPDWTKGSNYVNPGKLVELYTKCPTITKKRVMLVTGCSERQAKRYIRVINYCNKSLERHIAATGGLIVDGLDELRSLDTYFSGDPGATPV